MKIRTQLIISMVFFGVALLIISSSVMLTHQQVERLNKQEELAKNIVIGANELSYLSNDYLLYHERQQVDRWEAKFSTFSRDLSDLSVDTPDSQVLVDNIKANRLRLREIFDDIVTRTENTPQDSESVLDRSFIQVSGSRMGVQTQGIVFDATRLSQMLRDQADQQKQRNFSLIFALMGAFVAFLLSNYILFYRGAMKSIANLQAGIRAIGSGNLDFSMEMLRNDEIGELSRAFNRMASDLKGVTASKIDLEKEVAVRKRAEETLRSSEERYRSLFEGMTEGFAFHEILLDENGKPYDFRFLDINPAFERLTGLLRVDVVGKTHNEVLPNDSPRWVETYGAVALTGEPVQFEDYSPALERYYEVFAYRPAPGQFATVFMDISERKRQEEKIAKLTRLYAVLSRANEAMVRIRDLDLLFAEVCRIVANIGDFPLVWIGRVKDHEVLPVAWSGPASDYLKETKMEVQGELGQCPTGISIREDRSVVNDDFSTNPDMYPWRDPAQRYGFRSSAAFPIRRQGLAIGAFTLYSPEPRAFDAEQVSLLESLSSDISYALDALEQEQLRIHAEEGLHETRDYLENLIGYANAPIIVWDPTFRITRFNHAFERLTGLTAAEVLGEQLDILFPEESRVASLDHIRRALSGERWEAVEIPIQKTDGSIRTVLWNSANIYDQDGTIIVATIAQGQDITDRKIAEEGLRETRDYLENLIGYANAPIIVWDPTFRITRFNHAFERLTGLRAAEALGKQLDILFPEESMDASLDHIRRALSGERWEAVEIPIQKTDGSVRTVLWNSANIYDKEGSKIVTTIAQGQDITERKIAEEELRKTRDELEERVRERTKELSLASEELANRAQELARKSEDLARSNAELEQFAYVASHDLQEPLRMISSYVQLLSRRYSGRLDNDADEFIAYAVEGTKRMQQLINDLLAYSRVGTRGRPLEPTDFEQVFREAMANLLVAVEESDAIVTHDRLPTEMADEMQMVQLFQNLIGNAIKFKGHDSPRIHVSARSEGDEWIFSVQDNGIGIDPQFFDRIFTLFQRLHGRNEYPGTGIGLTVSKKIVERHGGRIWLESEPGRGTRFYFTIPRQIEVKPESLGERIEDE
jgi:PAS domain S-box-containing protein